MKLDRLVERISILPLFGDTAELQSFDDACRFIDGFKPTSAAGPFCKFEISIVFTNGDRLEGSFAEKERALAFLNYIRS